MMPKIWPGDIAAIHNVANVTKRAADIRTAVRDNREKPDNHEGHEGSTKNHEEK